MRKYLGYSIAIFAALLIVGTQFPTQSTSAKNLPGSRPESDDIDPDSMAALTRMGTYLRALKAFQVVATTSRDDVMDDGQLIQLDSEVNFLVRFPDRLRVEVTSAE